MRSNGLTASAYTPIADIDPRIVGPLLDELKQHGVAAYVTPVESSSVAGFDRPEFRTEVRDRLYVDAASADSAKELIATLNDEIDTGGEDLAWAQIVSGYDRPFDAGAAAPWPATEELDTADRGRDEGGSVEAGSAAAVYDEAGYDEAARRRTPPSDDEPDHHTAKVQAARVDDEDGFVPLPPPPLPSLEPRKQVAWLGVIGGPLLMLVSVLFSLHLPGWLSTLAVGGFVAGFIALVLMMGDDQDEDGGWDDGAVV